MQARTATTRRVFPPPSRLETLRWHPTGNDALAIGTVKGTVTGGQPFMLLDTSLGGVLIVGLPAGCPLPHSC